MPADFTHATTSSLPTSSPLMSFLQQSGCKDMNDTIRVHCEVDPASLMIRAVPESNLAALQPCSQVSMLALTNAALQCFLLLALESNHGRKDLVSFLVLIFSYESTQFCNTAKLKLCPLFLCLSC